jgi:hypothetical protein
MKHLKDLLLTALQPIIIAVVLMVMIISLYISHHP